MRLRAFLGDHIVSILLYAAAFGITLFFLSLFARPYDHLECDHAGRGAVWRDDPLL